MNWLGWTPARCRLVEARWLPEPGPLPQFWLGLGLGLARLAQASPGAAAVLGEDRPWYA